MSTTITAIETAFEAEVTQKFGRGLEAFSGEGLDDLTAGGVYTGSSLLGYTIEIDAEGTPDTFRWTDDSGATWTEDVSITGSAQTLGEAITVTFNATTGHTLGESWFIASIIESTLGADILTANNDDLFVAFIPAIKKVYRENIIVLLKELQDADSKNDLEGRGNREAELKDSLDDRIK